MQAARVVRERLAGVHDEDGWSLEDMRLVATELVGNAVRHSGGDSHHLLEVIVKRDERRLLISVHDPGLSGAEAETQDNSGESSRLEPGGWGLRIVARLSERWGAERPDGYRVWAELAIHPEVGLG